MRSGIVHHKSDRKPCVIPTADRNTAVSRYSIEQPPYSRVQTAVLWGKKCLCHTYLRTAPPQLFSGEKLSDGCYNSTSYVAYTVGDE